MWLPDTFVAIRESVRNELIKKAWRMAHATNKAATGIRRSEDVCPRLTLPSGSAGGASGVLHAKREGAMARVGEQVDGTRRATNGDDWVATAG